MERFYETEDLEKEIFGIEEPENAEPEDPELEALRKLLENEEDTEFPVLELGLELEDGQTLVCEAVGVFAEGERQYIALHPKGDEKGTIHVMRLEEGPEDDAKLLPIEDEDELNAAAGAFYRLIEDQE